MSDSRRDSAPNGGAGPTVPPVEDAATDLSPGRARGSSDKIPRKFGRYRIEECLGRGGMGAVFRAHDTQLDRVVALKVPFLGDDGDDTRQRFYREARAAATLHHANICPVFDVGEFQGFPYLTMAFIEGKSLAQVVKDGPPIAPVQAALLVRKLALAMQEAHTRGVIHRDLKPANVLMRANEPIIMDFGLARRGDDRASEGLTRQGDVIGTLEYMSPEQLDGDNAAVGPKADVYALGVVLYEVLTGRRPFTGTTVTMLTAILMKPPTPPREIRPDIPERLEEICMKAMARKPADRFESMAAFAAALADFIRSPKQPASGVAATAPSAESPTPRPSTTRPIREAGKPAGPAKPAFEVVETVSPPAPEKGASGASKSKSKAKSASRKKKAKEEQEKKSRTLLIGGIAAGIAVILVVGLIVMVSNNGSKPAQQPDSPPQPQVRAVAQPNPAGQPKKDSNDKGNAKGGSPGNKANAKDTKGKPPPPPALPIALKAKPESVSLPVGDPHPVTLELERHGYQGAVVVKWQGPPELRVSPAGPITLKPGDPDPVVTLRLLGPPAANARLTVTATPSGDPKEPKRDPATTHLAVAGAPGPCTRVLEVAGPDVEAMALTPDGRLALVATAGKGDADHPIHAWNLTSGEALAPLSGYKGRVNQLVVSDNGKTALSINADDSVGLWDVSTGKVMAPPQKQALRVLRAAISPDGKFALAAYPKVIVRVNLEKAGASPPINTAQLLGSDSDDAVQALAVSEDRKALVGAADGKLFLLDLASKAAKPKPLAGHKEAVRCAAFAPGGGTAATGGGGALQVGEFRPGQDHVLCVWDTAAATQKWKSDGLPAPVVRVAFSKDGRRLASGGADGEVRVWDADGKPVATFKGHAGRVLGLAFASDGKSLSSGAADGTIRQWRLP
jgi:serine/threonine protein kinase